jgi:hypothetical protein
MGCSGDGTVRNDRAGRPSLLTVWPEEVLAVVAAEDEDEAVQVGAECVQAVGRGGRCRPGMTG